MIVPNFVLAGLLLLSIACPVRAEEKLQPGPNPPETPAPVPEDKPWIPGWGFYPKFPKAWMQTHEGFVARAQKGEIEIVFLGDSITQGWDKEIWAKTYAPLKAVNFGMGGDGTRQILFRITRGEIDGIAPKLVVLKIGTNNLYNKDTDADVAKGIATVVETLRAKLPSAKILLLGILPRDKSATHNFRKRITAINAIIAKLDDGKTVRYLDMGPKYVEADGSIDPEKGLYTPDAVHLKAKGYETWRDTMQPLFDEMLKP